MQTTSDQVQSVVAITFNFSLCMIVRIIFAYLTGMFVLSCSPRVTVGSIIDMNRNQPRIYTVFDNIVSSVSIEDSAAIRRIKVGATEASFVVDLNTYSNKVLIPDTVNWHKSVIANAREYYIQMCGADRECTETLKLYNQVYRVIHQLNHAVNRNYIESNAASYIRREKPRQFRMSYEEEIRAESFVVAYLQKYEPDEAERIYGVIKQALIRNNFNFTSSEVKDRWNTFGFSEYKEMNLAILYIYAAAYESTERKDLEEFTRPT